MNKQPRILIWDIETSPLITYTWGIYQADAIELIEDKQILCVAWQWLGEKKVHCVGQDDFKNYKPGVNNDIEVVKKIRDLLNEADGAVAHNGDQFDVKIANARMLIHGLTPPEPYKQIDTKKLAKRVASFTSNRLKDLANDLNVNRKGDAGGFATWKGCLAGDKKAWAQMKKYNKQDIPPLTDLYLKLRPWDKSPIPMNVLIRNPEACPKCGVAGQMRKGAKYRATNTLLYQYLRCYAVKDNVPCGGMLKKRLPEYVQTQERMVYVAA